MTAFKPQAFYAEPFCNDFVYNSMLGEGNTECVVSDTIYGTNL